MQINYYLEIFVFQVTSNFWQVWKEFEVRHGNEDTMREMLRIKRSVQAMYNTQVNMMSAQMLNSAAIQASDQSVDAMRLLDSKAAAIAGKIFPSKFLNRSMFVYVNSNLWLCVLDGGGQTAPKDSIKFVRGVTEGSGKEGQVNNPDEMEIDMDADDDDDEIIEEGTLNINI